MNLKDNIQLDSTEQILVCIYLFLVPRSKANYISPVAYLCLCSGKVNTGTGHYSK